MIGHALGTVDEVSRKPVHLRSEVVSAKNFWTKRWATLAGTIQRKMNPGIAKLGTNRPFLQLIKAGLLAGDFDAFGDKEEEECILHAFGGILFERFVQDPRVISVNVESELLIPAYRFWSRRSDRIDNFLKFLEIGPVTFPSGIFHTGWSHIFFEQTIVTLNPALRCLGCGCLRDETRERENEERYKPGSHSPISHRSARSSKAKPHLWQPFDSRVEEPALTFNPRNPIPLR